MKVNKVKNPLTDTEIKVLPYTITSIDIFFLTIGPLIYVNTQYTLYIPIY